MEKKISEHNPVDFFLILTFVKKNIKRMALTGLITMVVSAVIVYSIPREYEATVVLAPEFSNSSSIAGNIGSLASMVGINIGNSGGEDAIYPEIYPDILSSTQFLTSMFDVQVESIDKELSCNVYDYYLKHQKGTWWGKAILTVKRLFKKKTMQPASSDDGKPNPNWLTYEADVVCKSLDNSIVCGVDKKTSVITLTFWSQDPLVSMTMAKAVVEKLQDYIIAYRTKKVRGDLAYMENLMNDSKTALDEAQSQYADFCDTHRNSVLQKDISERDRLETELSVCVTNYTQLAQQVQLLKGKVQERTPSFTVIKNPVVPEKPTKPKRLITMLAFFVLGMLGHALYKYSKDAMKEKIQRHSIDLAEE